MSLLKNLANNLVENVAEYYTLFCIVVAVPVIVAFLTSTEWGLLLSFVLQSAIGIFYIKGSK